MLKKNLKYFLLTVVILVVAYKSVYFKKLDQVRVAAVSEFDAARFSQQLWNEKLLAKLDSAINLSSLLSLLQTNSNDAFSKYSNVMGIGNIHYFLIKATGTVATINEDDMMIQVPHGETLLNIKLATEFVYGNAIRDASALVDTKDFTNAMDLNHISEELNKIIRGKVLPTFLAGAKVGSQVELVGAIEMNKEHININELEVIPARLKIIQ